MDVSLKLSRPVPCIRTIFVKKKRWVIVTGDSLVKGTEGVVKGTKGRSLLPGAPVEEVSTLVWPSDCYPLLIFQVRLQGCCEIRRGEN